MSETSNQFSDPQPGGCSAAIAEECFRREICDALELLTFAIERGKQVSDAIIEGIEKSRKFLNGTAPTVKERADFEKSFRDLAQFMTPVTAETLRATDDRRPGYRRRFTSNVRVSDARLFYWKLWIWALACLPLVLVLQIVNTAYVPDEENARSLASWVILCGKAVSPFLYGLLGALTYLLRCAHDFIADRSFDLRRVPEYSNRMLLGAIAGGVVLLFVDPKSVGFTQDAIALAVGYNTDTLFDLLGRVGTAIVSKSSSPAPTPPPSTPVSAPDTPSTPDTPAGTPGLASCVVTTSKSPKAGTKGFVTLTLNAAAPDSGTTVNLDCSPAGAVTFNPPSVTIAASATSSMVMFTIGPDIKGNVIITASAGGASVQDQINVL